MKRIGFISLFFLAGFFFVFSADSDSSRISMFRGNPQLTGVLFGTEAVTHINAVKYTFSTNGPIRSSPAIYKGVLYFGSGDGNLYALDAKSGRESWRFKTGGALNSNPAITNDVAYFASRDGFVYAVQTTRRGKELWRFKLQTEAPFDQGYDYFLSSPTIANQVLYIGSGDGNVYALKADTGKLIWKYDTGARIRTTPAVIRDSVVVGGLNGIVYSISRVNGSLNWKFATRGAGLHFEDVGYDQTSIICSPAVNDKAVYVGGRDGFLYALDLETGKELWRVSHDGSWVLAAAIDENNVYAASGSASIIQAVDLLSGKEKWRFKTQGAVYPSPILVQDVLYSADYNGNLFAIDKNTGKLKWSFPLGDRSFATPVVDRGMVYAAADNGILFALDGSGEQEHPLPAGPRKIVYWQGSKSAYDFNWFGEAAGASIRDHFKNAGYEVIDVTKIEGVIRELIEKKTPAVIVFADNKFPEALVQPATEESLIRKYLDAGGKIVLLAANPLGVQRNPDTGDLDSFRFGLLQKVFGITLYDRDWMNVGSVYSSYPTEEGLRWGLRGWWVSASAIDPEQVTTVLAKNEFGMATSWLKNYGGPKGTGLLQLCIPTRNHAEMAGDFLSEIQAAAEYGITW